MANKNLYHRALPSDDMAWLLFLTSTSILGEATLFSSLNDKLHEANNYIVENQKT